MNLTRIPALLLSPRAAWRELMKKPPSTTRTFANVALPLALLPPAMILLATHTVGAVHFPTVQAGMWELVAAIFLVAELLSIFLMTWAVDATVRAKGGRSDMNGAFLVAAIAPLPLWISSLGLLSSSLTIAAGLPALGLAVSAVLIRQGIRAVLSVQEVDCREVSMRVIGLGMANTLVLAGIVLLPLFMLA